jgi:hypothetical protein
MGNILIHYIYNLWVWNTPIKKDPLFKEEFDKCDEDLVFYYKKYSKILKDEDKNKEILDFLGISHENTLLLIFYLSKLAYETKRYSEIRQNLKDRISSHKEQLNNEFKLIDQIKKKIETFLSKQKSHNENGKPQTRIILDNYSFCQFAAEQGSSLAAETYSKENKSYLDAFLRELEIIKETLSSLKEKKPLGRESKAATRLWLWGLADIFYLFTGSDIDIETDRIDGITDSNFLEFAEMIHQIFPVIDNKYPLRQAREVQEVREKDYSNLRDYSIAALKHAHSGKINPPFPVTKGVWTSALMPA